MKHAIPGRASDDRDVVASDPLRELARSIPAAFDERTLRELARRLRPFLDDDPATTQPAPQLLTAAQAARRAGVNVETVRRAIRAGELEIAARIGRSPRISEDAVSTWLAGTVGDRAGHRPRPRRFQSRPDARDQYSLRRAFAAND